MNIVIAPDPTLRQVCEPCEVGDRALKRLAKQMAKAMYKNDGCGLAAPQVGVMKRIVVVDCDPESNGNFIALVNPVIAKTWGEEVVEGEGCLSCPGITVPIARKEWARCEYFDLDGNPCVIESDGLLGRCLQHECDHLDGKTLFESCSPMDRIQALRDYEVARAAGARPGQTAVEPRVR